MVIIRMNLVRVTVPIFSFTGKKIVASEVLLTDKALTWSHFTSIKIFNHKFWSFMGNISLGQTSHLNLDKVGIDR